MDLSELQEKAMSKPAKLTREELEAVCRGYSEAFKAVVPEGIGFAVFLFDFGEKGNLAYFSSADRADMVKVLVDWIHRQHSGE